MGLKIIILARAALGKNRITKIILLAVLLLIPGILGSAGSSTQDEPIWVSPKLVRKRMTYKTRPKYPVMAKINYIQGKVLLEYVVDVEGQVKQIHVVKGHPFLAIPAMDAIRKWRYKSMMIKGRKTAVRTRTQVDFRLTRKNLKSEYVTPRKAAKDLVQRVKPPELLTSVKAIRKHGERVKGNGRLLRLKVLLDKGGRAVDASVLSGALQYRAEALEEINLWTFKPAYFGNLAVPWYLEVEVPLPMESELPENPAAYELE